MADKLDVTSEPTGPEDEGVYAPDPKPIEADQEGGAAKPAGDPAAEVMGAKQPFADLDKVDVTEKPKPFDLEGKGTTEPEPQPEPEPEPQTPPGFGPDPTFFREPEPAPSAQDDEFKDFDAVRRDPSTAVRDLVQGMSDEETLKEFDAVRPKQPAPTATPAKPAATEAPKPDLKAIAAKTGKAIDEVRREALKVERDSIDKEMQGLRDMETERVGMTMPGLLPFLSRGLARDRVSPMTTGCSFGTSSPSCRRSARHSMPRSRRSTPRSPASSTRCGLGRPRRKGRSRTSRPSKVSRRPSSRVPING